MADAQVTVRPARGADVEEISETAVAAWREGFRGIVPEHVEPERSWGADRIAARLGSDRREGRVTLVAEVDGTVRGMVLLGPSRDAGARPGEGEVVALYVHPSQWRGGVGRRLVEAALGWLRNRRYREVIVWTLAESPRNLAFYSSLGFVRDGGIQRRPSFGSPLEVRFRIGLAGGMRRSGRL